MTLQRPAVALLALFAILICAVLDARYLCNERRFRGLYDKVRQEDWSTLPSFEISLNAAPPESFASCLARWAIWAFYAPLALAVTIVVIIAGYAYGQL